MNRQKVKFGKCVPMHQGTSIDDNASLSLHNKFAPLDGIEGIGIDALDVVINKLVIRLMCVVQNSVSRSAKPLPLDKDKPVSWCDKT